MDLPILESRRLVSGRACERTRCSVSHSMPSVPSASESYLIVNALCGEPKWFLLGPALNEIPKSSCGIPPALVIAIRYVPSGLDILSLQGLNIKTFNRSFVFYDITALFRNFCLRLLSFRKSVQLMGRRIAREENSELP
jgi:hypothetical protein